MLFIAHAYYCPCLITLFPSKKTASGLKSGNFIRYLTKSISLSSTTYFVTVIYSILGFLNSKILTAVHLAFSMILMCPENFKVHRMSSVRRCNDSTITISRLKNLRNSLQTKSDWEAKLPEYFSPQFQHQKESSCCLVLRVCPLSSKGLELQCLGLNVLKGHYQVKYLLPPGLFNVSHCKGLSRGLRKTDLGNLWSQTLSGVVHSH